LSRTDPDLLMAEGMGIPITESSRSGAEPGQTMMRPAAVDFRDEILTGPAACEPATPIRKGWNGSAFVAWRRRSRQAADLWRSLC